MKLCIYQEYKSNNNKVKIIILYKQEIIAIKSIIQVSFISYCSYNNIGINTNIIGFYKENKYL